LALLFLFAVSFAIWSGYLLSTTTEVTTTFQDDGSYIENGTSYNFSYWVRFSASSVDGFLAGNTFHLKIYGFIEFKDNIPNKKTINTSINFIDFPILVSNDREIKGIDLTAARKKPNPKRFNFSWEGDLKYVSSGAKRARPIVRTDEKSGPSLKDMVFIDISPPYITTELKLMKATIILTIWIIFLTVITILKSG